MPLGQQTQSTQPTQPTQPNQPIQPSLQELEQNIQGHLTKVNNCIAEFSTNILSITPEDKKQKVEETVKKLGPAVQAVSDAYIGKKNSGMFSYLGFGGKRRRSKKSRRIRRRGCSKKMRKTCKR